MARSDVIYVEPEDSGLTLTEVELLLIGVGVVAAAVVGYLIYQKVSDVVSDVVSDLPGQIAQGAANVLAPPAMQQSLADQDLDTPAGYP